MTDASLVGLAGLGVVFLYAIVRYGVMFYREARGPRNLSTLAGAAAVIAIIISIVVGTLTQPLAVLTPPPAKKPAPVKAD
ncbi:hypothetical protein [Beijerinckia sp. L45]|uniref:hypothetical protein n=1 Tax=Beijerinckia sp. L45 TaxID=1641855 RepID=UPI00131A687C|nr:hypothetical protein [Beijerinckia sp. L45]